MELRLSVAVDPAHPRWHDLLEPILMSALRSKLEPLSALVNDLSAVAGELSAAVECHKARVPADAATPADLALVDDIAARAAAAKALLAQARDVLAALPVGDAAPPAEPEPETEPEPAPAPAPAVVPTPPPAPFIPRPPGPTTL